MSKKERAIISAINAIARAAEAYGKISDSGSGFIGVRIEPKFVRDSYNDPSAEVHVSEESIESLAKMLGVDDIKEHDEEYENDEGYSRYHRWEFYFNGVCINALKMVASRKGEN